MKVILCGYHWTGCKALEILLDKCKELFVYTHNPENCVPDLSAYCEKMNIPFTTQKIELKNMPFVPDVICSIYYRYIIDEEVIKSVKGKIFNLHPSLLPKYRGCSSLTWAMINNEKKCGYTYHYIEKGCDTGKIIIQKELAIEEFDTQLTLYNRVMTESMKDFEKAFMLVSQGIEGVKQEGSISYYTRGCPYEGKIDDTWEDSFVERFIRAMIFPPYPCARYRGGEEVTTMQDYLKLKKRK